MPLLNNKAPDVDRATMEHLRAALDELDKLEAIVDDGCYSEDAERYIRRLRNLFERDLAAIERKALEVFAG